jgi:hypothetical protein
VGSDLVKVKVSSMVRKEVCPASVVSLDEESMSVTIGRLLISDDTLSVTITDMGDSVWGVAAVVGNDCKVRGAVVAETMLRGVPKAVAPTLLMLVP